MNKTEMLVVARDEKIREEVVALINKKENWLGIGASTAEDAIEKLHRFNIDLLVLTGDTGESELRKLRKIFAIQKEDAAILQPVSLTDAESLYGEMEEVLKRQKASKKPSWSIMDDALKGAALDIHIE